MSEESSTGAPETPAPEGSPVPSSEAEAAQPSVPRRRAGPWGPWLRRTSLRVRIAAAIVVAAVIAAVAFVAVPSSSSPSPKYSSLPPACALISEAALAKYLPDPAGTAESVIPSSGYVIPISDYLVPASDYKMGECKWSSTVGGVDRTLEAQVLVFGSSSPVILAQQDYDITLSALKCRCQGITVSTRAVTSLGDQATALSIAGRPDPDVVASPDASSPGAYLVVRSSNAEIRLIGSITATGPAPMAAPGLAQLDGMISVARGILAALARHAAVSSHPPVSPEPHYTRQPDPCRMITMATLATYVPGSAVTPGSAATPAPGSPQTSQCTWDSSSGSVSLTLNVFPDALTAEQQYQSDVDTDRQNGTGEGVTGAQWLPGLGEQAVAIFQAQPGATSVLLEVWSGNVEIAYSYEPVPTADRAALLAGVTAMARDSLAALANPAASSGPEGPVYASPRDACTLIRTSTLAAFLPGATTDGSGPQNVAGSDLSNCFWSALPGDLNLFVTLSSDADEAEAGFGLDVQSKEQPSSGITVVGTQPVTDLGEQATAIFQTVQGSPSVDLLIWSGNAEIEVTLDDVTSPSPGRATMLADDVAAARDVLARLPRS